MVLLVPGRLAASGVSATLASAPAGAFFTGMPVRRRCVAGSLPRRGLGCWASLLSHGAASSPPAPPSWPPGLFFGGGGAGYGEMAAVNNKTVARPGAANGQGSGVTPQRADAIHARHFQPEVPTAGKLRPTRPT